MLYIMLYVMTLYARCVIYCVYDNLRTIIFFATFRNPSILYTKNRFCLI